MHCLKINTCSSEETRAIGQKLGEIIDHGIVILLNGSLGAGKTCFTQGLAIGLDVPKECPVTSPSYSLLNVHSGRMPLYHFDLYRLEGIDDLSELGYDEFAEGTGTTVVEWAERVGEKLEANLQVEIRQLSELKRQLTFTAYDVVGGSLLDLLSVNLINKRQNSIAT